MTADQTNGSAADVDAVTEGVKNIQVGESSARGLVSDVESRFHSPEGHAHTLTFGMPAMLLLSPDRPHA